MVESPHQTHNRIANNEQECTRDCLVRWHYGEAAMAGLPPERGTTIRDRDLFSVPSPVNNALYAYGDCLLWRGPLNSGGYAGNRHRQVYEEASREKLRPGEQVNHLCQRPFCLQSGHLYAGDKQDNSDDRKAHDGSYLRLDMLEGIRVPSDVRAVPAWWQERQATWLQESLPSAAQCHHHAGPRSFMGRQVFCQVCLLFLEDEERPGRDAPLHPQSCGNSLTTTPWRRPGHPLTGCVWPGQESGYLLRCGLALTPTRIGSSRIFSPPLTGVNGVGKTYRLGVGMLYHPSHAWRLQYSWRQGRPAAALTAC